jgi:hypothetical protein
MGNVKFQNTRPGISPNMKPRPIAKARMKLSLAVTSAINRASALKPNHTIAHKRIKKIGKKTKNRIARSTAMPGKMVTKLVKNTYLAQKRDVPGKPIVTSTASTEKIHNRGADSATPPI